MTDLAKSAPGAMTLKTDEKLKLSGSNASDFDNWSDLPEADSVFQNFCLNSHLKTLLPESLRKIQWLISGRWGVAVPVLANRPETTFGLKIGYGPDNRLGPGGIAQDNPA